MIFNVKGNPNKESMFEACFGKHKGILEDEVKIKRAKILLKFEENKRTNMDKKLSQVFKVQQTRTDDDTLFKIIKDKGGHWQRLKTLMRNKAAGLVKW